MIIFAVLGVILNSIAAYITRKGDSVNQRSVNLHMLEDVMGWSVVLVGSVIIKYTDVLIIDSLMSIGVAGFIIWSALGNLMEIGDIFLEKIPPKINLNELKKCILSIDGVENVHHIHVWSLDGVSNYITMHIVMPDYSFEKKIKSEIRSMLLKHDIVHCVLETETEPCDEMECKDLQEDDISHHLHHHHH